MTAASLTNAGPPAQIYIIRHGEKPADLPTPTATPTAPFGVDVNGNQDIHSLLPRGWQRSGALAVGQESALASAVVANYTGVVLICWEHQHIPAIGTALPTVAGTQIPAAWPGDRFDLIWSFSLQTGASTATYQFNQIPQQVLAGEAPAIIQPTPVTS